MGDHTETLEVDFDPGQVSYKELLEVFWRSHNPSRQPWSRQYMSIVFYHSEKQLQDIEADKVFLEQQKGKVVKTKIRAAGEFYRAEAYHQKYYLQLIRDLMKEFSKFYPRVDDFINSTAAARINGYVKGTGSFEKLRGEVDSYGLTPQGKEKLLNIVAGYKNQVLQRL